MEHLTPFDFYKAYNGLTLHFKKPEYDWFLSKGFVKTSAKTFDTRKDAKLFAYAASKIKAKDVVQYFLSNIIANNKQCVYNVNDEGLQNFKKYQKKIVSLSQNFNQELRSMVDVMQRNKKIADDLFIIEHNSHPQILKLLLSEKFSLETAILIDKFCRPFIVEFDEKMGKDFVWEQWSIKLRKYSPFLDGKDWIEFDQSRIKMVWHDFVNETKVNIL